VAIAQQLTARHDVHVFSQESNHPVEGVTYHRVFCLSRKPRWINQIGFAVATWLKTRRGFDVVHSHENTWHGQIQTIHVRPIRYNLFFDRSGIRLFLRWVKVLLSPRLITYVLLEGARFKASPTRRVVATSETLLLECQAAYPTSQAALSVITPGTCIPEKLPSKQIARQVLGLPETGRFILFVANDYAKKGLDTLLTALLAMPADMALVVVGSPKASPKYKQQVERLGLSERVYFLGSLQDMTPAYCAADCLAHPTLADSFAMVVLEAMAHQLPVVVSGPAHCGISRHLQDGVNALLLADPKDPHRLAELINLVLSQDELAETLRHNGVTFAAQHSWESSALQYEQLYER
jgi:UDP-glucose:(heptosyl)LPS alpha-1,3-glucosyltransferase